MLKRFCLGLTLLAVFPAWSQSPPATETPMELPPPVTGQAYPNQVGSDVRSNYLGLGVTGSGGWDDNVLSGYTSTKTSSAVYSLSPYISFDKLTARTTAQFRYTPAFTFYSSVSALNEADQNASGSFQYRVTPHFIVRAQDWFVKSSSFFGSLGAPGLGGGVSGALPVQIGAVIATYADRITNTATVDLGLQTSENTLIGAEGTFSELDYLNSGQSTGLFNANSVGATGFFTHRVTSHQYIGFTYQYLQILSYLPNSEGEAAVNTFTPFYSFHLLRTKQGSLTASLQGGLEHASFAIRGGPYVAEWTPVVTASVGWQGSITNFAVSYTQSVSGGGGLNGLFQQDAASAVAQVKVGRSWGLSAGANYMKLKDDSPQYSQVAGGHTIFGSAGVGRTLGRSTRFDVGYSLIHQSYPGLDVITQNPDSNRVYGSVSYQFTRPVGR